MEQNIRPSHERERERGSAPIGEIRQADNFFFVLAITTGARERPGDSSRERGAGAGDCLVISSREREAECKEPKK